MAKFVKEKPKQNAPRTSAKTPSTQKYLPFREIRDGVVVLKDGTLRRVLLVSSLNFALKSQEEQEGIIQGYVQFLNGLDFELQIVVQSRPLNIQKYLDKINRVKAAQTNELLKRQTASYGEFIETMVKGSQIMDKKFFVVIPFSATSKKRKSFWNRFQEILYPASSLTLSQARFNDSKEQLDRRVFQVSSGLQAISLQTVPLDTQALIELYYNTYNPSSQTTKKLGDLDKMQIDWDSK